MKLFSLIILSMFSQLLMAAPAPGEWEVILKSESCKVSYILWELKNSNLAVLEINSDSHSSYRAMTLKVMNTERRIYETNDGLSPSFQIAMKEVYESSLPTLLVSKWGQQEKCVMTHAFNEAMMTNVGTVGH